MVLLKKPEPPDWEDRYRQAGYWCGPEPVEFLREHLADLPRGAALDLAMGEGRNALFLARNGFAVTGVEKSPTAIGKAQARAREEGFTLTTVEADLEKSPLPAGPFDVVLCFYYLQRSLWPALEGLLKPGGALLMETYTIEQLQFSQGPRNPAHLLQPNELYRAFRHWRVAHYREIIRENRALASLLAGRI